MQICTVALRATLTSSKAFTSHLDCKGSRFVAPEDLGRKAQTGSTETVCQVLFPLEVRVHTGPRGGWLPQCHLRRYGCLFPSTRVAGGASDHRPIRQTVSVDSPCPRILSLSPSTPPSRGRQRRDPHPHRICGGIRGTVLWDRMPLVRLPFLRA